MLPMRSTLAKLDLHGLSGEIVASLRFLVQAQALFMASAHDEAARGRWAAFVGLSGAAASSSVQASELFRRLSTASFAAQLPQAAGLRHYPLNCMHPDTPSRILPTRFFVKAPQRIACSWDIWTGHEELLWHCRLEALHTGGG